jgi:hypothetical protein
LRKLHPARKIKLLLHSSGVTHRQPEFNFDLINVDAVFVDDFSQIKQEFSHNTKSYVEYFKIKQVIRSLAWYLFEKTRIAQRLDNSANLESIRPWTFILRGHYTRIKLDTLVVNSIYELLISESKEIDTPFASQVIHYRLGDLLHLLEKSPVNPSRLLDLFNDKIRQEEEVEIISDSTVADFKLYTGENHLLQNWRFSKYDPVSTIIRCTGAKLFIGTNSKISIWSAIFRLYLKGELSYLPKEMRWLKQIGVTAYWY